MTPSAEPERHDRLHPGEGEEGARTPFERDKDAILYSSAFRRLAGVTQVVSPIEGEIHHNRLTHTLKVAQIARSLANKFQKENPETSARLQLDSSVVEAAAYAHDLGHPPFGHIAEHKLNEFLKDHGGYEGNAQSFRVVTKLAVRNNHPGLNLTRAVLNGILKYPWLRCVNYNESDKKCRKWGAYETEKKEFEFARGSEIGSDSQSLEAQIMDWADDITYSIHDTEDFYRAGLIPLEKFTEPSFVNKFLDSVFQRWNDKNLTSEFNEDDLKKSFEVFCSSLNFTGAFSPTRSQKAELRSFISRKIGALIKGTELLKNPDPKGRWLKIDENSRMQVEMIKELTWQYVIKKPSFIGLQEGQKKALGTVFLVYKEAASEKASSKRWVLPTGSQEELEGLENKYGRPAVPESLRLRVAADAVAALTDSQVIVLYQKLIGIKNGMSLVD